MHSQITVVHQTFLDFVSPSDNPLQPGIGCRLVVAVIDEHSHFAADALQPCPNRQRQNVLGFLVRLAPLRGRIDRLRIKQLDQVASTDIDLNAIEFDVYTAE